MSGSLSRFAGGQNQRYRANGSHDRYLITGNRRIVTRNDAAYPLNGLPGAGRPTGTKPQEQALPEEQAEQATTVMMDQLNFEATRPVSADSVVDIPPTPNAAPKMSVESLASELGLKLGDQNELTIRRIKRGKSYSFIRANGTPIRHVGTIRRLNSMAVPPAYAEVRYAPDPTSHLQAVGRDAAGRLQYRYHSDWEKVREHRKAHRLARLVAALPKIRRNVSMHLKGDAPTREFALSAVIELIARTAIRPGNESYARLNRTRGATTLLKSNVALEDG